MSPTPRPSPTAPRLREEALDWFVRRRGEGFGADEERAFQAWLASDAAHGEAFARWQAEWQAFDAIPPHARSLLQRRLAADLAADAGAVPRRAPPPRRRRILAPALAFACGAVILGGTGLLAWNHWQAQPVFVQSVSTPRGQQAELALPDGSRLRLDTATRLEVAYYRRQRQVTLLDGQAVFSVQGDAGRPFHVLAGPLRITVVGTRFSVRHTPGVPGDEDVRVAVEAGRVRVERAAAPAADAQSSGHTAGGAVLLAAGQQIASDAAGTLSAIAPVSAAGIAPWRDNRVSFDNLRLDRALAELARYRDPQLVIRDPAVAALPITGVFDPQDTATFRRLLPTALPVRIEQIPGGAAEIVLTR